jgi:hypothetical protein
VRVHAVALRHGVAHGDAKHLTGAKQASRHRIATLELQRSSTHRLAVRAYVGDTARERLRGAALSRGAGSESEATHHARSARVSQHAARNSRACPRRRRTKQAPEAVASGARAGPPVISSLALPRTSRALLLRRYGRLR